MSRQPDAASFAGVTLSLGGRPILRDLNLTLPAGAFIGILGPNGAGKTTLLRAMLGLIRPAAGTIEVLGGAPRARRAGIGYMPQSRTPLSSLHISGRDLVAAAAGATPWQFGRLHTGQRRDVARAIAQAGAAAYAHRPVATLSGGERQRLLLAQALLGSPKMLLLDEPLSSLDPHHQAATIALVKNLQTELGITVCFTAHELNPLLPALDQVLYLGNGEAALGPVAEVVTPETLSRLYGAPIDVLHVNGRIFVMAEGQVMERDSHVHL
jgi:zinc/manganese transport system ATP-binding protein